MTTQEILIVDDEQSIRDAMSGLLQDEGYITRTAESGQQALDMVAEKTPDLVLLDIWMEGMDGLEVLSRLKRRVPELPVVMISGHGTIETAVQATMKGAYDFIEKPPQAERLLLTISRAIREFQLRRENVLLRAKTGEQEELLGSSSEIATVRHMIKQVAVSESRIMISGEPGSGKEVVARLIHRMSSRADKNFISLNPSSVDDSTFELALWGAVDQGFGGTLFIDEVADLTPNMQGRLLRFLQESYIEDPKTGAHKEINLRFISSSSQDVKSLVETGQFRADLFYRLNVVPVEVPSLRDRSVDIPALVQHFIKTLSPEGCELPDVSSAAMSVISSYTWPGNVRQLKNVIEWLTIMHPGETIVPEMLPQELTRTESETHQDVLEQVATLPLRQARETFEKCYLKSQLKRFGGNISRTAHFVGMERSALHRKLKSLGVETRSDDI